MNKKLAMALSGGAALVLALTGCSDDEDESKKKADAWAKQACDDMQPQLKKIVDANVSLDKAKHEPDQKKYQKVALTAFGQISQGYSGLSKAIKDAGAPPVDDSEKLQKDTIAKLDAAAKGFTEQRTAVQKLDTSDKGKFAKGLQDISANVEVVNKSGADALKKLQVGDLGEAMARQPGCQKTVTPAPSM
ncbi:small secreted protein [Streptomyces sp. XD-27]|uniref:small secreted protein n=1 Tax=Streptomyces sp. XD-27 TaxID=3062779 RepID=UPI0026F4401E|nr:small secreted protein [Streptomyces sp. XD-27]WKX71758.1 small secreted protein [Streptomyces sp. XD-27]